MDIGHTHHKQQHWVYMQVILDISYKTDSEHF